MTQNRAARLQFAIHELIDILADDIAARAATKVLASLPKQDHRPAPPVAEPRPYTGRRLIRMKEVMDRTGLAKSTIYDWMKQGVFPQPVPLGGITVAWLESDIDAWIEERLER